MSQSDVLHYLEKNPNDWFTAKQISQNLKVPYNRVTRNLRVLRKTDFIICKNTEMVCPNCGNDQNLYNCKNYTYKIRNCEKDSFICIYCGQRFLI